MGGVGENMTCLAKLVPGAQHGADVQELQGSQAQNWAAATKPGTKRGRSCARVVPGAQVGHKLCPSLCPGQYICSVLCPV